MMFIILHSFLVNRSMILLVAQSYECESIYAYQSYSRG